jgi:DNA primase
VLIPEHKIEEVLERTDIVALVSRHVELKKAGRSFKGRCPFHQEKTPSFQVTPELRRFKCFGCGGGGDAIAFLQRYLGKTFVDSVRDLAREAGVDLEAAVDPTARERQELKEVTDLAAEHFRAHLWDAALGAGARAYLAERGMSEETARRFGLGWAPLAWSGFADVAQKHGVLEWAEKAGLVQKRSRGEGFYDTFRGRLIVPIRAPEGRPIAFGGRLLEGDGGPKYLNSRESRLYNKSDTLYGLDVAKDEIRRLKAAVLVEGYFDCMALHQAGVRHTVALCSTALTPGHLKLLQRAEAKELFLLLDGDEAGRKAVERLAGVLLAHGTASQVALLPDGEDPDTFARKSGLAGVQSLLGSARPLSEHLFSAVLPKGAASAFEEKMQGLEQLRGTLAQLPVGLARSAFISGLARHVALPAAELEAALRGKTTPPRAAPKPTPVMKPTDKAPDALEAALVAVCLRLPALLRAEPGNFAEEVTHPGLRALLAHLSQGGGSEDALYEASDRLKLALEAALQGLPREAEPLEEMFQAIAKKLRIRRIDEQLSHIARTAQRLVDADGLGEEIRRLQQERIELLSLRKRVLEQTLHPSGTKVPWQPV